MLHEDNDTIPTAGTYQAGYQNQVAAPPIASYSGQNPGAGGYQTAYQGTPVYGTAPPNTNTSMKQPQYPPTSDPYYVQGGYQTNANIADGRDNKPLLKVPQGERFSYEPVYKDKIFAILFIVDFLIVLVLFFIGIGKVSGSGTDEQTDAQKRDSRLFGLICLVSAILGVALSILYLWIIKKYAHILIWFTMLASAAMVFIFAIILFALGNPFGGVVFLFVGFINLLLIYFWRSRIPFATAVLETAAGIVQQYPATTSFAIGACVLNVIWLIVWIFAFAGMLSEGNTWFGQVFLVFSLYWTFQVIKNLLHVTISGTVATWFFLGDSGPENPTLNAFKRGATYSFGSICFGSLLVALIQTARWIVRSFQSKNQNNVAAQFISCIIICLLNLLDRLVQYFNKYAYVQVATYGKSFTEAARDTWHLFEQHAMEALINDDLISGVLIMGSFVGAIIVGIIAGIWSHGVLETVPWGVAAFAGFFIGYFMMIFSMQVVDSAVATIFVCFAEEPQALQKHDKKLYERFVMTYNEIKI